MSNLPLNDEMQDDLDISEKSAAVIDWDGEDQQDDAVSRLRDSSLYGSNNLSLENHSKYAMLSVEQEQSLIKDWQQSHNPVAAKQLIESHLRLIAKIARKHRGYGLSLDDLLSEGLVGMMRALDKFDPEKGFRLSTYASWWINASIKEYIVRTWSIVKMSNTAAHKKLFFTLRSLRNKIQLENSSSQLHDVYMEIAHKMNLPYAEVDAIAQRLDGRDASLNVSFDSEGEEWQNWFADPTPDQEITLITNDLAIQKREALKYALSCLRPREYDILSQRHLQEPPPTLESLSIVYGISRERVRQLEKQAFEKVQSIVLSRAASLRSQ